MTLWPLPGGSVSDPAVDQNLRSLAQEGSRIEHEILVPRVAKLPATGTTGQLLFNEADSLLYYFNGSEWVKA
jgi:hypothetical protein